MEKRDFRIGHTIMFISTLFFGINIPALKLLMPKWFTASDSTVFRIVGAAILFWIVSLFVKNDKIEKKDWFSLLKSGVIGLFPFFFFFNLGIQYSSPVDVSIIMTLPPILVILYSVIFLKEKITVTNSIGLLLSLSGALMLILIGHQSGDSRPLKGNIYTLVAASAYVYYLISIRKTSAKYRSITFLRWIFLFASILSLIFGLTGVMRSEIVTHPEIKPILILLFVIFFPTFLSYLLIPMAIKRIGQGSVSTYLYFTPVITTATAIILKMSTLQWDQPIAVVIILLGLFLNSKKGKSNINDQH